MQYFHTRLHFKNFPVYRCDKVQGETIPINHARPSRNFAVTRREPIGVCGLVTPWNYPLMMLSWKMAACLAAGNTVVIKPAQVCPLTALKFAELSHKAGIPPGVINVVTGSGSVCGQAIAGMYMLLCFYPDFILAQLVEVTDRAPAKSN